MNVMESPTLSTNRHRFHKGTILKKKIVLSGIFVDILNYFNELYNPTMLQGLEFISFVITLIGKEQNECEQVNCIFTKGQFCHAASSFK